MWQIFGEIGIPRKVVYSKIGLLKITFQFNRKLKIDF